MEYISTLVQNFHNLEEFYRLWLHAAAVYIIFGLAVDFVGIFFFKE
jgi:hypothetical protein